MRIPRFSKTTFLNMKQLKVTVTGWKNLVYIGNENEVFKWLTDLRESQINAIPIQTHKDGWEDIVLDKEYYKKVTTKSKICHFNNFHKSREILDWYDKDITRREFEKQNEHLGLKIKIETIQNPIDNLF
jgi:hypothetical protein